MIASSLQGLGAGILLGLSIAAPPGPVSAAIAQRVTIKKSWIPGVVMGLGAMTADAVYLLITYLGWTNVVSQSKGVTGWVYLIGALVLFLYGSLMILRQVRKRSNADRGKVGATRRNEGRLSYFIGLSLGFSNPYQIAWWLTVGLASISFFGSIVIIGFFAGIILWLFILSGGLHYGANRYPNFEVVVLYGSSVVLFGFAIWFLYNAIQVI